MLSKYVMVQHVMTVNDKVHPKMTPAKAVEIIDELKEGECE